ncbi:MAG: DUF937 domain-containing protein [Paludibacter sp.]|nr:DUF937 domain-containing protein [Paludibacter sp.]
MLENLIQLVKENATEAIVNNPAIPNEQNDAACETAATSIFDSLKNEVSNGGLSSITDLLSNNGGQNSTISTISNNVASELMSKFGLESSAANNIVQSLVPNVVSQLTTKTNDPNDSSFNLQGIISSLTGGDAVGGVLGKLKGLIGL